MTDLRVGFLVGELTSISGGSNVIIEHASGLAERGCQVTIIAANTSRSTGDIWHKGVKQLKIAELDAAMEMEFDFVFATWWLTVFDLGRMRSRAYGYFNQSLESRFHEEPFHKELNRIAYALPLFFVTEAAWLEQFVRLLHPEARTALVRNGLNRNFFPPAEHVIDHAGPLRVLVEGPWSVPFKRVPETFAALDAAAATGLSLEIGWLSANAAKQEPRIGGRRVAVHEAIDIDKVRLVLRNYDVMLKLSRVEGVFGPPLEMFSQGGTAITSTVTGSDDYIVHGYNGLITPPYAHNALTGYLRALSEDRQMLHTLKDNALSTARQALTWGQSTDIFFDSLRKADAEGWSNAHARPVLEAFAATAREWTAAALTIAKQSQVAP